MRYLLAIMAAVTILSLWSVSSALQPIQWPTQVVMPSALMPHP